MVVCELLNNGRGASVQHRRPLGLKLHTHCALIHKRPHSRLYSREVVRPSGAGLRLRETQAARPRPLVRVFDLVPSSRPNVAPMPVRPLHDGRTVAGHDS